MKKSTPCALLALLLTFCACARPEPRQAASPVAVTSAATPAKVVPALAERVLALLGRADLLGAHDLAVRELAERLARADWRDEMLVADSIAAAELLTEIAEDHDTCKRTLAALGAMQPLPAATPWELAAVLQRVYASMLRNTGAIDRARAETRVLGVVTDWQVIGPFDNERGGGFDVAQPPEQELDLAAAVRGKERDVSWRVNPGREHPLGRLVLEQLMRPNSQVVAYLATAIDSPREREVALQLGASCAVKVFVNGHEALARKVRRPFHSDQDVVVVPLAVGVNQLLIKLAIEDWPNWVAETRFTELDGRPALDLAIASTRAATPTLAWREPQGRAPRSASDLLADRPNDPHAARLAALLAILRHPDDIASKSEETLAEHARDLAPDDVDGLWLVAWSRRPSAITTAVERQVQPELDALRAVVARDADHALAWVTLAEFYLQANPIPSRGLEYAANARRSAPRSLGVAQTYALALAYDDQEAEARRVGAEALEFDEASTVAAAVVQKAQRLTQRGERDAALALLERAFDERGNLGAVFDELARRYVDAGRLVATNDGRGSLESIATRLFAASPFAFDSRLDVARDYELAGDFARAREHLEAARALAPEDRRLLRAATDLAVRENDLARADRELAELLRLDPGDALARRRRALLAASTREHFEEPYRRDARELVKSAAPVGTGNDPIAVLDRTVVYRVGSDGGESHYEHLVLRVQNAGGIKALDHYGIVYPAGASLEVRELRVLHADGRVESAPPPRRDQMGGGGRYRAFDVPPLAVGDVLDVEYRIDDTEPDVFGEYFGLRHVFYADAPDPLAPVARSEFVVIAPADVKIYAAERNGEKLERSVETDAQGRSIHRWVARDLVRPPLESAMPRREEFAPLVDVSTYASWNDFSKWWWAFIEKEFVATPAMKAKVAELTAGLPTEREKVRALTRFVGQEIRYNAWEFGPHGYQPYSAATIFERRFGDCKDKSILLVELLKEIGVEANPVLIEADYVRPEEPLALAMVEHFNHCIAYVKPTAERDGYYLDATADRNPIEYLRSDDQGANVLHVDASGGSIHPIPYAPPEENARRRDLRVELAANGAAEVHYRDTSNGTFGVQLRYTFGGEQGDLAKRFADTVGEGFGKVEVRRIETSKLEDLGAPVAIDAEFHAENLWTREADGASLRLAFERFGLDQAAVETPSERRFDVVLDRPFLEELDVTYVLPEGARVVELPPKAEIRAEGLCSYSLAVEQTGNELHVTRRFRLDERRIPLARYADFRDALQEIRQAEDRTIRIQPPPPREAGRAGGDK
ncbi:MAG: DUF3857 domain-containing protein [Planctomycetes bacterium]|nr:DUF3857 domain-containing protein [Planctomycetota bacterium]